ncbi:MAG: hypothetical protein Q8R31_04060 [Candidatus Omnitrophota bacterium]|nr:hypothetical protein [Candidatus Omnitrophota bacterium]
MTLKKSKPKRGQALFQRGQAIFEYFILTTVVVAVVLFFASSPYFQNIKTSCENAFNKATEEILK